MNTLKRSLQTKIIESEGRYLDMRDLQPLELYVQSYTTRLQTYHALRDQSENLIIVTLQRLSQEFPDLIQQHGKRCQYDMTEVLRYIAL